MNRHLLRHPARSFLAASLITGAAFTAHAQTAEAPAPQQRVQAPTGQAAEGTRAARAERRPEHRERMQARSAQRLDTLKTQLNLSSQQTGAWDTFAAAMQPNPDAWRQRVAMRADLRTLTTPERIEHMRAWRSERNAAMDQRLDATQAFYAQLSPEQQKTFDARAMTAGRMGRDGHRHGMHEGKHARGAHVQGDRRDDDHPGAQREGG